MYIFLDLETTGLNPINDLVLELAAAIVDEEFEIVDERVYLFPMSSWVAAKLDGADPIVKEMHTANHLIAEMYKLQAEGNNMSYSFYQRALEMVLLQWFSQCGLKAGECELAGSGVHFDRTFLVEKFPNVAEFLHYRNWDVSTLKRATQRWAPEYWKRNPIFTAESSHRAMSDVRMAVEHSRLIRGVFSISEQVWSGHNQSRSTTL